VSSDREIRELAGNFISTGKKWEIAGSFSTNREFLKSETKKKVEVFKNNSKKTFDLVFILAKNSFFLTYPALFALLESKGFYSGI